MKPRDPFVEGLRLILAERPDITPARLGLQAGLSDSTLRKLLAGKIESLSVANAKAVARKLGYDLSTIIALGEHPRGPDIVRLALAFHSATEADRSKVQGFLQIASGQRPPEDHQDDQEEAKEDP